MVKFFMVTLYFSPRPFIILTSLLIFGCANPPPARVIERQQPPTKKIQTHGVVANETLYSIAWRYNLDYKKLARHNAISAPFTIYKGQSVRLDVNNQASRKTSPVTKVATIRSRPKPVKAPVKPVSANPKAQSQATKPSARRSENKPKILMAKNVPTFSKEPLKWRWPTKGRVLSGYTSNKGLNKGIDIGGNLGQPVTAATSGEVVYAGTGLRGYGKLLIIKHSEIYLSAYAHNRVLNVKEGESVKVGQQIAEMGSSGTDKIKLHFEIRKDGKSVNPLSYLPK